jgi:hypothetical protein
MAMGVFTVYVMGQITARVTLDLHMIPLGHAQSHCVQWAVLTEAVARYDIDSLLIMIILLFFLSIYCCR